MVVLFVIPATTGFPLTPENGIRYTGSSQKMLKMFKTELFVEGVWSHITKKPPVFRPFFLWATWQQIEVFTLNPFMSIYQA